MFNVGTMLFTLHHNTYSRIQILPHTSQTTYSKPLPRTMDFGGPASDFHMRLCSTLKGVGLDFPMGFLLVGIIINTMALIVRSLKVWVLKRG
jgi:hypothetical protein